MSQITFTGPASGTGTVNISAPVTNTERNLTLPDMSGTITAASSGTADATTFLRGDGAWAAAGAEIGDILVTSRILTAPTYLPANGSAYLQSSYPTLFGLLGSLPGPQTGIAWTSRTSGFSATSISAAAFGNGLYLVGGGLGKLSTSTDGVTWTLRTSGFGTNDIAGLAFGNGIYVAVGFDPSTFAPILTTSPDGATWTVRTIGFTVGGGVSCVTFGNGTFVAANYSGELATSTDGTTWTVRTSSFGASQIRGITFGNGVFVAVGTDTKIATSPDGITWTQRTSLGIATGFETVTFGNGLFVTGGQGGRLATSPDGITWTQRTSALRYDESINGSTFGAGFFIITASLPTGAGLIITSTDGINWTKNQIYFGGTVSAAAATFGNGLFIIAGGGGKLSTSSLGYDTSTQFVTPQVLGARNAYVKAQ